jgi:hypothetical protein
MTKYRSCWTSGRYPIRRRPRSTGSRILYLAAETISPASFDGHFDELLERQRELISEYFMESGGLSPADPIVPAAPALSAEPPSSPTPLGFDTAASLAALRGELRNAD